MTNMREKIAENIYTTLKSISGVKKVSRDVFFVDDLAQTHFPALHVRTGAEIRNDESMGTDHWRMGVIDFVIVGFVKGKKDLDTARNDLVYKIGTQLYLDVTRGGYAEDTVVREVQADEGQDYPYGAVEVIVRVEYDYQAGNP